MTQEDLPEVYPDQDPKNADWTKAKWDLPKPGTPEYEVMKRLAGDQPLRPSWPELQDGEDARLPDLP